MGRRFIAGAICPRCGASDTTYIDKGAEPVMRHCIDCGFSEQQPGDVAERSSDEWTAVRLPGKDSSNE